MSTWEIISSIDFDISAMGVDDNEYRLSISVNGNDPLKYGEIIFFSAISYRITDESYCFVDALKNFPNASFCKTADSDFIEWLKSVDKVGHEDPLLMHFRILSNEKCVDIISLDDPLVIIPR